MGFVVRMRYGRITQAPRKSSRTRSPHDTAAGMAIIDIHARSITHKDTYTVTAFEMHFLDFQVLDGCPVAFRIGDNLFIYGSEKSHTAQRIVTIQSRNALAATIECPAKIHDRKPRLIFLFGVYVQSNVCRKLTTGARLLNSPRGSIHYGGKTIKIIFCTYFITVPVLFGERSPHGIQI